MSTDPQRFARNLEWLAAHASEATAAAVREADPEAAPLAVSAGDDGGVSCAWITADGRRLALHSRRDPVAEAGRQVDAWAAAEAVDFSGPVMVVGFGGWWHIREIASRLEPGGALFVADLHPAVLAALCGYVDLTDLDAGEVPVRVSCAAAADRLGSEFRVFLSNCNRFRSAVFFHPPSRRARAAEFDALEERFTAEIRAEAMSRSTLAAFSDEWQQNVLLNLPDLAAAAGVDALDNGGAGWPAIVAAAGPSLNDALPHIAACRDHAVIIAVGTALKSLLAAGIEPHLVVAVDSDPVTRRQFDVADLDACHLVAADSIDPAIVRQFRGRTFAFSRTVRAYSEWLETFGAYPGLLSIGGTVSLTAIDVACKLGCGPVVLCGLDLAYREDGTTHANHSMYDGQRASAGSLVRVPGNRAETVPTTRQFAIYIDLLGDFLDDMASKTAIRICNANNQGARIRGTELVDHEDIPALAGDRTRDWHAHVRALHADAVRPMPGAVRDAVDKGQRDVRALLCTARRAEKAARRIRRCGEQHPETGRWLRTLERCDRELKSNVGGLLLVDGALKATTMHLLGSERPATDDFDGILKQSLELYRQVGGAADWVGGLLRQVAARLTADEPANRSASPAGVHV